MKKTSIFRGNQHVEYIEVTGEYLTRMQKIRLYTRIYTKQAIRAGAMTVAVACLILGGYKLGTIYPTTVQVVQAENKTISFEDKVDQLKNDVINQLMNCESPNYTDDDALVTYDPLVSNPSATPKRNIPSFGRLQFKKDTVIYYYKMQTGKTLTAKEAVLLALDTEKAIELAKYVGFETKNKFSGDWVTCSRRHNLDMQVDIINKLSK